MCKLNFVITEIILLYYSDDLTNYSPLKHKKDDKTSRMNDFTQVTNYRLKRNINPSIQQKLDIANKKRNTVSANTMLLF